MPLKAIEDDRKQLGIKGNRSSHFETWLECVGRKSQKESILTIELARKYISER
ncbi:hypothetical protein HOY82DRAFT_610302 [Tuber indicum]|nr:hypothetical protein HOY82DRAFT_610302 [Tuber indicum]